MKKAFTWINKNPVPSFLLAGAIFIVVSYCFGVKYYGWSVFKFWE